MIRATTPLAFLAAYRAWAQIKLAYLNDAPATRLLQVARGLRWRTGGAIVDATFRRRADRGAFTTALKRERPGRDGCRVSRAARCLAGTRASARSRPVVCSDATADLVDRQLDEWAELDEVDPACHATVRGDRDVPDIVEDIEAFLDQRAADGTLRFA